MWTTREIHKHKGGLELRDMDRPRADFWATLAMLEEYTNYQQFLWKDFQLKRVNDERTFHMLRYGEIILAYTWFTLNFRLTKTACVWLIKHILYFCFKIQRIIQRCILIIILIVVCLVIFKCLSRYYDKVIFPLLLWASTRLRSIKEKGGLKRSRTLPPSLPTCPLPAMCLWKTSVKK